MLLSMQSRFFQISRCREMFGVSDELREAK